VQHGGAARAGWRVIGVVEAQVLEARHAAVRVEQPPAQRRAVHIRSTPPQESGVAVQNSDAAAVGDETEGVQRRRPRRCMLLIRRHGGFSFQHRVTWRDP
jgi:hypothetical protein